MPFWTGDVRLFLGGLDVSKEKFEQYNCRGGVDSGSLCTKGRPYIVGRPQYSRVVEEYNQDA